MHVPPGNAVHVTPRRFERPSTFLSSASVGSRSSAAERALAKAIRSGRSFRGRSPTPTSRPRPRPRQVTKIRLCLSCNRNASRMGPQPLARLHREPKRPDESTSTESKRWTRSGDGEAPATSRKGEQPSRSGASPDHCGGRRAGGGVAGGDRRGANGGEVTVFEKQLHAGDSATSRWCPTREFRRLIRNQFDRVPQARCGIEYGVERLAELHRRQQPRHVIIATGAESQRPWWVPGEPTTWVERACGARRQREAPPDDVGGDRRARLHQATSVAKLLADRGCRGRRSSPTEGRRQDLGSPSTWRAGGCGRAPRASCSRPISWRWEWATNRHRAS